MGGCKYEQGQRKVERRRSTKIRKVVRIGISAENGERVEGRKDGRWVGKASTEVRRYGGYMLGRTGSTKKAGLGEGRGGRGTRIRGREIEGEREGGKR